MSVRCSTDIVFWASHKCVVSELSPIWLACISIHRQFSFRPSIIGGTLIRYLAPTDCGLGYLGAVREELIQITVGHAIITQMRILSESASLILCGPK